MFPPPLLTPVFIQTLLAHFSLATGVVKLNEAVLPAERAGLEVK